MVSLLGDEWHVTELRRTVGGRGPLYKRIQREIAHRIATADLAPGEPLPTRSDLAAQYRTTRATVDRAMQELVRDGLITGGSGRRTLVLAPAAKAVQSIAVVWSAPDEFIGTSEGDFFVLLMRGIRQACEEHGIEVHFRPGQLSSYANILSETRAQGLLVVRPYYTDAPWLERLTAEGLPVVVVPGILEAEHVPAIASDNFMGMDQAIDHLVSLGHRDIGVVSLTTMPDHFERFQGFLRSMARHDLMVHPRWILVRNELWPRHDGHGVFYGQVIQEGLDPDHLPTAFVAADLLMGLAVQRRLNELGFSVPQDVSLINFDDTPAAAHLTPALTVIKQHTAKLGYTGVQRLIQSIRGEQVPRVDRLPTELIVRESTARPRR